MIQVVVPINSILIYFFARKEIFGKKKAAQFELLQIPPKEDGGIFNPCRTEYAYIIIL